MRPIVDSEGVPHPVPPEKGGRTWADAHVSLVRRTVGMTFVAADELHRRLKVLEHTAGQESAFRPLVVQARALRDATEKMKNELSLDATEIPKTVFDSWEASARRAVRKKGNGPSDAARRAFRL